MQSFETERGKASTNRKKNSFISLYFLGLHLFGYSSERSSGIVKMRRLGLEHVLSSCCQVGRTLTV